MALEIERKFLVCGDGWRTGSPTYFKQGYLNRDKESTVRVRIAGERAFLTVKGPTHGLTRTEFEYEVPVQDAQSMLGLCQGPLVEKNRWLVPMDGLTWEVDEFFGSNDGLIIAEIELPSEDHPFDRPSWVGTEVSGDKRYFNSQLSLTPFKSWPENQPA